MEDCDLNDREHKTAVKKKLSDTRGSSERQFDELRNKINKQKWYFTKENETIKKNQTESLDSIKYKAAQIEELMNSKM